eukprot:3684302-Alexandrium_andersonii.AAC.1
MAKLIWAFCAHESSSLSASARHQIMRCSFFWAPTSTMPLLGAVPEQISPHKVSKETAEGAPITEPPDGPIKAPCKR